MSKWGRAFGHASLGSDKNQVAVPGLLIAKGSYQKRATKKSSPESQSLESSSEGKTRHPASSLERSPTINMPGPRDFQRFRASAQSPCLHKKKHKEIQDVKDTNSPNARNEMCQSEISRGNLASFLAASWVYNVYMFPCAPQNHRCVLVIVSPPHTFDMTTHATWLW